MKKLLLILLITIPFIGFGMNGEFQIKDVSHLDSIYQKEIKYINFLIDSLMELPGGYSTRGMNFSVNKGIEEYDILLNKYYNLLKKELPEKEFTTLRDSQKKWLKHREDYLRYIHDHLPNGTMYSNVYTGYRFSVIKERVEVLFKIYRTINEGYINFRIVNKPSVEVWIGDF